MNNNAILHLSENDEVLKSIIETLPFPTIESTNDVFHDLMSCVIEQQIHYRSTKKTFQKMLDAAGIEFLTLDNFSTFEEGFKNVKISTNKYAAIERTVDFLSQNNIHWQDLTDQEVRAIFKNIKGIGTWTVDMILLYTLQRKNIFPADDYHLKNLMFKLYEVDTTSKVKSQLKAIAASWSPYQSIATRYLLDWKAYLKR